MVNAADSKSAVETIADALAPEGYDVVLAANGRGAFEYVEKSSRIPAVTCT